MENKTLGSNIKINSDNAVESFNNMNTNINYSPDYPEWLNFLIKDEDIREIYIQSDRIKNILIIQAIFYLNIFKGLHQEFKKYKSGIKVTK
jgi:hypothetical protein